MSEGIIILSCFRSQFDVKDECKMSTIPKCHQNLKSRKDRKQRPLREAVEKKMIFKINNSVIGSNNTLKKINFLNIQVVNEPYLN